MGQKWDQAMGSGEGAYHWSYQGTDGLSRCVDVCWHHGILVSQAEVAGPPTCWWCPCGRCSSELCTNSPLQWKKGVTWNACGMHAWKKEEEGWVSRNHKSVALSEVKWQMSTANLDLLTLCPLALESGPQVEQCGALLQQWVWILHTNLVNVIHTQLKLTCQLCLESDRRKIKKAGEIFI